MTSELGWPIGVPGSDGPLAEFTALRQEMERRATAQSNLLTLQLTISGAIFSFALSDPARRAFLLILPISTYMLCGRYAAQHAAIAGIATYIRESLSDRVPGGLHWERWLLRHRRPHLPVISWVEPLSITFPGVAVLSLAWVSPQVLAGNWSADLGTRVGLVGLWLLGIGATVASIRLVWVVRQRFWLRQWRDRRADRARQQKRPA